MKKSSKKETQKEIEKFFSDVQSKTPKEIKKVKKLAMSQNIKLGDKRKLFCKKCFSPYMNSEIRTRKGIKTVKCGKCGYVSRYKISNPKLS